MKPEQNDKLKLLLREYLEKKELLLNNEIWNSSYVFSKSKGDRSDYKIKYFFRDFSLATKKDSENYKFWKYVYQKDILLSYDMVLNYIKYPSQDYSRKEYIESLFSLYTNNKKEDKLLWSIVSTKTFLNNNITIVKDLCDENILSNIQKQEIIKYYTTTFNKNNKLNTLENHRIVSLINQSLIKPIDIDLIKEKQLEINVRSEACVYFEITVKELMQYSLKLSDKFSENLLYKFSTLLPQVVEAETSDIVVRKKETQNIVESYNYVIFTKLESDLIKKIFSSFVDNYIQIIDTTSSFPKNEDILDCLKFSVIKARKENLENNLVEKGNKSKFSKI